MTNRFRRLSRRDFLRLAVAGGATLTIPALYLGGQREAAETQAYQQSAHALGTTITIRIEDEVASVEAKAITEDAVSEIRRLEALLTRFHGGTQICRLNQTGTLENPSAEVLEVLQRAARTSEDTGGSFDITVKPALDLLQGYLNGKPFPTDVQFDEAKSLIGYEGVSVTDHQVNLAKPRMGVTLDGIATGYILDRAASQLKSKGIRSALINIGGSIKTVGSRGNGDAWAVGIADPLNPFTTMATLHLRDQAVATSGDYENFFTPDRRYYHIIDPSTAHSPLYSRSVTVVAGAAIEADSMSVALMVDDPSIGPKLADKYGFECLTCTRSKRVVTSAGMNRLLK